METPLSTRPAPGAPVDWSQVSAPVTPMTAQVAFGVGPLLSRTFSVWAKSLPVLLPLGLAAHLPVAAGVYLLYSRMHLIEGGDLRELPAILVGGGAVWLLSMFVGVLEFGAIARGALGRLEGRPVGLGAMLGAGFARFPAVLGILVLVLLAVIPATLLLVVPAVVLLCCWCASVPAAVAERLGPVRALSRSWALTDGYRWHVFGGFAVLFVGASMVNYLIQAIAAGAAFALGGLGPQVANNPTAAMALPMALGQLAAGVTGTITLVAASVAYHGLRAVKEGGDPAALARVFE